MQKHFHFEPDAPFGVMSWALALLAVVIVALYRMGILSPTDSELESSFNSPVTLVVPATPAHRPPPTSTSTDGHTLLSGAFQAELAVDTFWRGGPPVLLPRKYLLLIDHLSAAGPREVAVETCRYVDDLDIELSLGVHHYADVLTTAFLDADWSIVPGSDICDGRISGARLLVPSAGADTATHIIDAFGAAGIPLQIVKQPEGSSLPSPPTIQVDWQQ